MTLSGPAVLSRCEPVIDNTWGGGAPAGVPVAADNFSVRWTTTAMFADGYYTFSATGDDGIRMFVDGNVLIDDWSDHAARTTTSAAQYLNGSHTVTVEYYEHGYDATAQASWTPVVVTPPVCAAGRVVGQLLPEHDVVGSGGAVAV